VSFTTVFGVESRLNDFSTVEAERLLPSWALSAVMQPDGTGDGGPAREAIS